MNSVFYRLQSQVLPLILARAAKQTLTCENNRQVRLSSNRKLWAHRPAAPHPQTFHHLCEKVSSSSRSPAPPGTRRLVVDRCHCILALRLQPPASTGSCLPQNSQSGRTDGTGRLVFVQTHRWALWIFTPPRLKASRAPVMLRGLMSWNGKWSFFSINVGFSAECEVVSLQTLKVHFLSGEGAGSADIPHHHPPGFWHLDRCEWRHPARSRSGVFHSHSTDKVCHWEKPTLF